LGSSRDLRKVGINALLKSWSLYREGHLNSGPLDINTGALTFQGPSERYLKRTHEAFLVRQGMARKLDMTNVPEYICDLMRTCATLCTIYYCIFVNVLLNFSENTGEQL
jgi:hypothetical protein